MIGTPAIKELTIKSLIKSHENIVFIDIIC